jgi:ABC-type bacteriocin/lantibiotic exporter with double-glycine peptidase domain
VENVCFGWNIGQESLKNIELDIKKGQLVAIVGRVGAGKSISK